MERIDVLQQKKIERYVQAQVKITNNAPIYKFVIGIFCFAAFAVGMFSYDIFNEKRISAVLLILGAYFILISTMAMTGPRLLMKKGRKRESEYLFPYPITSTQMAYYNTRRVLPLLSIVTLIIVGLNALCSYADLGRVNILSILILVGFYFVFPIISIWFPVMTERL